MYYSWEAVISTEECESIIEQYKDKANVNGAIKNTGASGNTDLSKRDVKICWVKPEAMLNRVVASFMKEANERHFHYDMTGSEQMQFAKYEVDGKYCWHRDSISMGGNEVRKLTTVVQLSNPDNYEGGELQFFNGDNDPEPSKIRKQGSVIVFDALDWHRATAVTKGVRYTLAQWSQGANFI
tara:strand:- start:262 stop:807 length:546 start_codon:yes stop_codon:yes gene_type:complete